MIKKKWALLGSQVLLILFVIPVMVYRGLFYFRPEPNPVEFHVSASLVQQMEQLEAQRENLREELLSFKSVDDPKVAEQYDGHRKAIDKIEKQLFDLERIYKDEKKVMEDQLYNSRLRHRRSYYDFALFIGTIWILISAFIQVAFLRMSINVFGLASVLIGLVGVLTYMQETPRLSLWLLMLFFSLLAIAFLGTGYQIAQRKKQRKSDDKNV